MTWTRRTHTALTLAALLSTAIGCDSGETDSDAGASDAGASDAGTIPTDPDAMALTPLVGRFVHGEVEGLRYATASRVGMTNASGEFMFEPGEAVTFSVGGIVLGEAPGAATITPFDLAGMEPPVTVREQSATMSRVWNATEPLPMDRAVNLAVFLQSIDRDGDPSNGITISEAMHDVADDATLDFDVLLEDFFRGLPFRRVMGEARLANVFDGPRAVPHPPAATNALFAGVGIATRLPQVTREATIPDGELEATFARVYAYDARGFRTFRGSDFDADGPMDVSPSGDWTFDAHGAPTRAMSDWDADPTDGLSLDTYRYDENGFLIEIDRDCDLDPDNGIGRLRFTVDAYGNRLTSEAFYDGSCGTDSHVAYAYRYDERQRLVRADRDDDPALDNGFESYETYSYDERGNLVAIETYGGSEPVLNRREVFVYDDENRQVEHRRETGAGVVQHVQTWTYDGLTVTQRIDTDDDPSNGLSTRFVVVRDERGDVVLTYSDDDNNDSNGITTRSVYTRHEDGLIHTELRDFDLDDDNGISSFTTWIRDGEGRVVESVLDGDLDPDNGISSRTVFETSDVGWGFAFLIRYRD